MNDIVVATLHRAGNSVHQRTGSHRVKRSDLRPPHAHSQNYYRTVFRVRTSLGDPLMMIVPPFEQFLASYTVSSMARASLILTAGRFGRNFINVVRAQAAVGLIELMVWQWT